MSKAKPVLPLTAAERIDQTSDRFEKEWRAGAKPRIEDFLGTSSGAERAELFRSLLQVELELLGRQGTTPDPAAYHARFPDQAQVITAVFQGGSTRPAGDTSLSQDKVRTHPEKERAAGPAPATISRFPVVAVLGSGAFGTVYRCRDPQLQRDVAVKVPRAGVLETDRDVERFLREARAAATLHHPNVCPVYEVGKEDGIYYLVMAYVAGKSLADFLAERKTPLPLKQAALIVRKLAQALEAAHAKGIIHRDLKPSNVMLDFERREPVVMDFGLARRLLTEEARLTHSGMLVGTPAYMSPEQAKAEHEAVGPASDIYALGVILYELLTGRRPYEGPVAAVLGQILYGKAEPPSKLRPEVPPGLEAICLKAMARDVRDRYASMRELADALTRCVRGLDQKDASRPAAEAAPAAVPAKGKEDSRGSGLTSLFASLAEQQQAATRQMARWQTLTGAGVLGLLVLLGIMFFVRTSTAMVIIHLEGVNLSDKTLDFALDRKTITPEELSKPIELKFGEHELVVKRGVEMVKRFVFVVGKDAKEFTFKEEKPVQSPPSPKVDIPPPIAHWTFDDDDPVVVRSSVGTTHPGKRVDNVGRAPGVVGQAAMFDGKKSKIEIPDHSKFHFKSAMTVAAWVKPTQKRGAILNKTYALDAFSLLWTGSKVDFSVAFRVGGEWGTGVHVQAAADHGVWTHVAGVFDGRTLSLYINGKPAASKEVKSAENILKAKEVVATGKIPDTIQDSDQPIRIGNHPDWEAFQGLIDEAQLYDVALTDKQIAALAVAVTPPAPAEKK